MDSITTPREIPELSLWVNGQVFSLTPVGEEYHRFTWKLDTFTGAKGDEVTLRDAAGNPLSFTAEGSMLDPEGALCHSLVDTTAVLVATPEAMTLTIRDNRHPGIVV